jgi:uncharacterized protein YndB with AHSA1/START domain
VPDTRGTIIIGRPIEEVFAFIADLRNVPRWDPTIERVDLFAPVGVGAAGRIVARGVVGGVPGGSEVRFEVIEYEPPRRLSIRSGEHRADMTLTWTLEPVAGLGDITRLSAEADMTGRGLYRVAESLFKLLTPNDSSRGLMRLKDILESAPRPTERGSGAETSEPGPGDPG